MDVPCPSHLQLSLLSLAYWFSRLSSQESILSPSALLSLTGLKARPFCIPSHPYHEAPLMKYNTFFPCSSKSSWEEYGAFFGCTWEQGLWPGLQTAGHRGHTGAPGIFQRLGTSRWTNLVHTRNVYTFIFALNTSITTSSISKWSIRLSCCKSAVLLCHLSRSRKGHGQHDRTSTKHKPRTSCSVQQGELTG